MRGLLLFSIALAVLVGCNLLAIRWLKRIHPRRRAAVNALAALGNAMWLFFPLLRTLTPGGRVTRALFGPPWFAWQCFILVYTAFLIVAGTGFRILGLLRRPRRPVNPTVALRTPSRLFLVLLLAGTLAGVYEAVIPLRVERVPVTIETLPPDADGLRIAVLGDLHTGLFSRHSRLRQFFEVTRDLHPDLVILAGDLIDDDPFFVPKLLRATNPLPLQTPLLAVLGNHEMYGDPQRVIASLRGSRIRLLINDGIFFRSLWIAGLSDFAAPAGALRPDLTRALRSAPPGALPVVVAHQPKTFVESRAHGIPLTLVAHTHGGQLGFRPLRWSLAGVFLPWHMGLYRSGGSQLYVNTGTGFWLVPFRLGMTGEITLIELQRSTPHRNSTPP